VKSSPLQILRSITLGLLRNSAQRRQAMFFLLLAALFLLFVGATLLADPLRARPLLFLLWWGGVAWLTLTAFLLACYDMLQLRAEARRVMRQMRQEFLTKDQSPNDPPDL